MYIYLSWWHCICCNNSLGVATWSNICQRLVLSSPYLSGCFIHSVKEEVQKQSPSSGKTTYWGAPSPVLLWSDTAMQIQITMSNTGKWTYSNMLLIKHALVKRQKKSAEYIIFGSNWGEYHWGCRILYAVKE